MIELTLGQFWLMVAGIATTSFTAGGAMLMLRLLSRDLHQHMRDETEWRKVNDIWKLNHVTGHAPKYKK